MTAVRRLLLALAAAGIAAGAGASLASAGEGPSAGPGRIAPIPSPLPVPQVLLAAAQRLEDAAATSAAKATPAAARAPVKRATKRATTTTRTTPASSSSGQDHALTTADVLPGGIALPPLDAPAEVRAIIEAGNAIARTPYKWGGGHGRWLDSGYDCSGSVSFVLAAAGLLGGPLTSGSLMSWGEAGPGRWVTIYASPTHVFLQVAGVRFDTGGTRTTGSRWQPAMRPFDGFTVRHPAGL